MMLNDMKPGQLFQLHRQARPHVYRITGGERGVIGLGVLKIECECVGAYEDGVLRLFDPGAMILKVHGKTVDRSKVWVNAEREVKVVSTPNYRDGAMAGEELL